MAFTNQNNSHTRLPWQVALLPIQSFLRLSLNTQSQIKPTAHHGQARSHETHEREVPQNTVTTELTCGLSHRLTLVLAIVLHIPSPLAKQTSPKVPHTSPAHVTSLV